MKILSITAGAAGMYCGSCLRDNAVATELIRRGHDVTLMPVYTPTLTDEPNVSRSRVLFGGINVFAQQRSRLFRRMPRFLDALLDSPRLIKAVTGQSTSTDPATLGDLTLSMLMGTDGVLRKEFEKLVEWLADEPLPDIINLPNSLLIGMARPLKEAFGRPVFCTLQGEELFLHGLVEPYRTQALDLIRNQVQFVDRFLPVSDYCAAFMGNELRLSWGHQRIIPLGINTAGYTRRIARNDGVFRVGYLARVAPEKGLHVLADAFVRLRQRTGDARIRLEAAGYLGASDRGYLEGIQRALEKAGLLGDFAYHGTVDRTGKLAFLQTLDVLSVPATYDEPKGLFLLEAMASGVPVVQPRRGSFPEIVEKTGGGLLVDPDSPESLADGLHALRRDPSLAERLGQQGFDGVRQHYSIENTVDRLLEVYGDAVYASQPVGPLKADGAPSGLRYSGARG